MTKKWKPQIAGIARGCARWLTAPQPRSGQGTSMFDGDSDIRRAHVDLDAIRTRFPDHA